MDGLASEPVRVGIEAVAAPARTVAAVLAETWVLAEALARFGVTVPTRRPEQFRFGVELPLRIRLGGPAVLRLRCDRADERGIVLSVLGPGLHVECVAAVVAAAAGADSTRLTESTRSTRSTLATPLVASVEAGAGLRCELGWTSRWVRSGVFGARPVRRLLAPALTALTALTAVLTSVSAGVRARAEQLVGAPLVVGTAIVADGAVLAAQRERPAALAGRWEFPGGRVEPGEDEPGAVVRECREELGASVRVLGRLGPDLILPSGWLLRIHAAELVDGHPAALEHRSLRWVRAAELEALNWLDADRAVLPALRALLTARSA